MTAERKFERTTIQDAPNYCQSKRGGFLNFEKLNYEEERIKSFTSWPVHFPVDSKRLAKAGFYYSGVNDEVICFSCHGNVNNWNYGDVVLKKHSQLYPDCDFINNRSNNVPLSKFHAMPKEQSLIRNSNDISNKSDLSCTTEYAKMKTVSERLNTFTGKWPLSYISANDLADAGFFYTGIGDKVQCSYCGGIISNWEAGDVPLKEHLKHFPWCDFFSENILKTKNRSSWFKSGSEDVCGNMTKHDNSKSSDCFSEKTQLMTSDPSNTSSNNRLIDEEQQHMTLENLGVHLHKGPAHPQQASLTSRLRSFLSWPSNSPVLKEDLAAAGFFYIGISDHTKCFHCNGGLCNWEKGDDPWVEHARWFCNCDFLHLSKGSDFIKQCMAKYPSRTVKENIPLQSPPFQTVEPLMKKVDEAMKSNLVKYVLETELFPYYIVRAAILLQLKKTGSTFSNIDELCIAVSYLKEEMESDPLNVSAGNAGRVSWKLIDLLEWKMGKVLKNERKAMHRKHKKNDKSADSIMCDNMSKNCAISDAIKVNDVSSITPGIVSSHHSKKDLNNGYAENSANSSLEEDTSKDHCVCKNMYG